MSRKTVDVRQMKIDLLLAAQRGDKEAVNEIAEQIKRSETFRRTVMYIARGRGGESEHKKMLKKLVKNVAISSGVSAQDLRIIVPITAGNPNNIDIQRVRDEVEQEMMV